jgi:hypothetical protein
LEICYQTENKMKDLKEHWKEFVGDPSEYVPQILFAIGLVLASYFFGLILFANGV